MKKCFFLLLVTFLHTGAYAQTAQAETAIKDLMAEYSVPGMSVAVVKGGKTIYTKAFGVKDIAGNQPMQENTVFRIASISKSFSATAIMQLVKEKKLSLDADFGDLVGFKVRNPKYPDVVITLRMVLSHTSSINDSEGYFTLDAINPAKNPNWEKCYNNYAPGKGYQYCNLNFNMVGVVIEKFTGQRFDQAIKHRILDPLGLYGGYCVDSLDKMRFATLYEYNRITRQHTPSPAAYNPRSEEIKNYVMGYSTPIFSPTGGMKISAPDLAKYMTMHMQYGKYAGGRLISKKHAKEMQTALSADENYGLALRNSIQLIPGKVMTGHTGSAYGLYSIMFFEPKEQFGFVVIVNSCNPVHKDGFAEILSKTVNVLHAQLVAK